MQEDFDFLDSLNQVNDWYLSSSINKDSCNAANNISLSMEPLLLFRIEFSSLNTASSFLEIFEILLLTLSFEHTLFLYFVQNHAKRINFYVGFISNSSNAKTAKLWEDELHLNQEILTSFIKDNLLDAHLYLVSEPFIKDILANLTTYPSVSCMEGCYGKLIVPNETPTSNLFCNLIEDVDFSVLYILKPIPITSIKAMEAKTNEAIDALNSLGNSTKIRTLLDSGSCTSSNTISGTFTNSNSRTCSNDRREVLIDVNDDQLSIDKVATSKNSASANAVTRTRNKLNSNCLTKLLTATDSCNQSKTNMQSTAINTTEKNSNTGAKDWSQFLSDTIKRRLQIGISNGLYLCCTTLFCDSNCGRLKLGTALTKVASIPSTYAPLKSFPVKPDSTYLSSIYQLQIPTCTFSNSNINNQTRTLLSQYIEKDNGYYGSFLTSHEFSTLITNYLSCPSTSQNEKNSLLM
ncbi:MAG: hypothetical protein PHY47_05565 [Lachnospiraceae bacterium]|nr:hypothetical protein [Lachnospiraceae bacterium]